MRVVIDTNVLISGTLRPSSVPGEIIGWAVASGAMLLSREVFDEYRATLLSPKFARYFPDQERAMLLRDIAAVARWVEHIPEVRACRDPRDDKFLALAVAGGAGLIVSGDADLLLLDPFEGVAIKTPRTVLDRIRAPH